ncbi:hypothetical protein G6F50_015241 [Rhizopus delemar]|uniref:Uncharacterized protein n=1 Tax=Rhizopus delemar TaxID=936053 RepID=A0A9P6XZN3_9FUNG|nr:hypothetical protein G6F50_015241 [Rhizopus delemar]
MTGTVPLRAMYGRAVRSLLWLLAIVVVLGLTTWLQLKARMPLWTVPDIPLEHDACLSLQQHGTQMQHAAGATRPAERAGRDNAGPTRTRAALAGSPDCRSSTAAGRRTAAGIRRIAAAHRHIADGGRAAAGHLAQIAPGLPGTGHERPVGPGTGGAVAAAGARRCRAAD